MIEYFNQVFLYIIKYSTLNNRYKNLIIEFKKLNKQFFDINLRGESSKSFCKNYEKLFENYWILREDYKNLNKQYKIFIEDYKNLLKEHEFFFQENNIIYETYIFLFTKLDYLYIEYLELDIDYVKLDWDYMGFLRNRY